MNDNSVIMVRESSIEDFPFISQSSKQLTGISGFYKKSAFENRVIFFPEGQISVSENEWTYLSASAILISSDFYKNSFRFLRGPEVGYISDHNPDGDTLFVFNIIRDEKKINYSALVNLTEYYKKYARKNNFRKILLSYQSSYYPSLFLEDNLSELISKASRDDTNHELLTPLFDAGFKFVRIVEHRGEKESYSDIIFEWSNFDFREKLFYTRKKKTAGICAVQTISKPAKNFDEYASRIRYFVELAASYKRDFVVFPELTTFSLLPELFDNSDIPLFISKYTSEFIDLYKQLAHKNNINIIAGSTIINEEDSFYNTFFLFCRNGDVGKQKKIHLSRFEKEKLKLETGDKVEVFATDICEISILSGYDVQFPELPRKASNEGAVLFFIPFITFDEKEFMKIKLTARTRCIENQVFAVLSGATGKINAVSPNFLYGKSMVLTPLDFVFSRNGISSESDSGTEGVILDEINLELLRRNRRFGDSSNWIDKRPELYKISWNSDKENL